jgi:hypothetical protein
LREERNGYVVSLLTPTNNQAGRKFKSHIRHQKNPYSKFKEHDNEDENDTVVEIATKIVAIVINNIRSSLCIIIDTITTFIIIIKFKRGY